MLFQLKKLLLFELPFKSITNWPASATQTLNVISYIPIFGKLKDDKLVLLITPEFIPFCAKWYDPPTAIGAVLHN